VTLAQNEFQSERNSANINLNTEQIAKAYLQRMPYEINSFCVKEIYSIGLHSFWVLAGIGGKCFGYKCKLISRDCVGNNQNAAMG
jgi:hypothetical protein